MRRYCEDWIKDLVEKSWNRSKKCVVQDKLNLKITFFDQGHSETFRSFSSGLLKSMNGIIFAFDVSNRSSFEFLTSYYFPTHSKEISKGAKILILGNKIDKKREVSRQVSQIIFRKLKYGQNNN